MYYIALHYLQKNEEYLKRYHKLVWNRTNVEHIAKHRVLPEEVEEVCFSKNILILRGRGKHIYYALGQTDSGRYLFIVLRELKFNSVLPVTARNMSDKERKRYQEIRR